MSKENKNAEARFGWLALDFETTPFFNWNVTMLSSLSTIFKQWKVLLKQCANKFINISLLINNLLLQNNESIQINNVQNN